MSAAPAHSAAEYIFLRRDSLTSSPWLFAFGGLFALGCAALGLPVAIFGRVDQLSLHFMTTMPTLLGLAGLAAAWQLASAPRQVTVGPEGIVIDERKGRRALRWSELGWANIESSGISYRRSLVLCDTSGKTVARLTDAFDQFDTLAELVKQRIAARPDNTADQIGLRKARKSAAFCAFGGAVAILLGAANGWIAHREQRAERLLATQAIDGEAHIVSRHLAPNGVTPRLEYEVTTDDGRKAERNAEVTRPYWDSLAGQDKVPVRFVPGEPSISRLAQGEPEERDVTKSPGVMYALSAVVAAMGLFFLGAAALQFRGWDIDLDSKTGKISIKRFGTGR